jgi:hypothetical protein
MLHEIEKIFQKLDAKLADFCQKNETSQNFDFIASQIEKVFDLDSQKTRLNRKRSKLIRELDQRLENDLSNHKSKTWLTYFKHKSEEKIQNQLVEAIASKVNKQSSFVQVLLNMFQLGRLFVKDEFTVLKKLRYMSLYFDYTTHDLEMRSEFYQLTKDKYVLYDVKKYELCLVSRSMLLLKKVKVHPIYNLIFVDIHNGQLVVTMNNHGCSPRKAFIYLFDENLDLLDTRIDENLVYSNVSSEKKKLVYSDLSTSKFVLLDRDLSFIETYDYNSEAIESTNIIHLHSDTIYSLISSRGLVQINDRKSGDLIKEIDVTRFLPNFFTLWIKIDYSGNIYIFVRVVFHHLLCFDMHGEFLFQRIVFTLNRYSHMEFMDDNVYFFGKSENS